jgi:hypothetical protein
MRIGFFVRLKLGVIRKFCFRGQYSNPGSRASNALGTRFCSRRFPNQPNIDGMSTRGIDHTLTHTNPKRERGIRSKSLLAQPSLALRVSRRLIQVGQCVIKASTRYRLKFAV